MQWQTATENRGTTRARFGSNFDLFTTANIRRQHGHGALEARRLVHATCMRLLSHLHATCEQNHDCNYCNRHVFLGKSEKASEFTSCTRTVTSEHTIELIKL